MSIRITGLKTLDLRFPTSRQLDGSDAMNPDPDYSAAYVILYTSQPGLEGHGLTFMIGRGNEICCAAIAALRHLTVGLELDWIAEDMGRFWRSMTSDSQLRWIGPDKGAMHLATGAIVNAVWDLWAKASGKPLWRLLADMDPEELLRCIDFRYLTDCIAPGEALEEPTSPDDVEGHRRIRAAVAPVMVATGEMCQNRSLFKQFIMREALDIVQIDACRLGGVNEVLAVMLMAAKYELPVCPHAGGVGLCEYVQHLAMVDYLCIAGTREGRVIEYVDHLHEHFVDPCVVHNAAYLPPGAPGFSITMKAQSRERFAFGNSRCD